MGLTGTNLDRYEVQEELGRGGMSVVYKGFDSALERVVAIKVLHDHLTEDQQARDRLQREAVAVAKLQHQNIIEVFDFSTGGSGPAYIVMEYVEGESLAAILKRINFSSTPEEGLYFLRRMLCALEHAHDNGVIHRDLKPENVLLSLDGRIKLTDFGIARLVDGNAMTMTGTLLGSPGYMAPEYIEAKPTDHRVDIFAFGVLLYRSLTGSAPFEGESPASVLLKITKGEFEPANAQNANIHPMIASLIERCLATNPAERFRSAKELKEHVDKLLRYAGVESNELSREVLPAPTPQAPASMFTSATLSRAYLEAFELALKTRNRTLAHGHADRLLGLDSALRESVTTRLATLGTDAHRSRFPMVFAVLVILFALGMGIASTLIAPPPEPTLSSTVETPSPENAVSLVVGVECETDKELRVQLNDSGAWISLAELSSQRVPPGEHRLVLRIGQDLEEHKVVVAPSGQASPAMIKCRSAIIPPLPSPTPKTSTTSSTPTPQAAKPSQKAAPEPKQSVVSEITKAKPQDYDVTFRTGGAWVDVEVDGTKVRESQLGVFALKLREGTRKVKFLNPLAKPLVMTLNVDASTGERPILIKLSPLDAKLAFSGFPAKTVVQVRGKATLLDSNGNDEPLAVSFPENKGRLVESVRIILPDGTVTTQEVELKPGSLTTLDVAATR